MTITWGAWEDSGGNGMRAGIQIESVTTPVTASTTFIVTFSCWTQNRADYADAQTFDLTTTGGVSASLSDSSIGYTNNEVGTATKRGSNQTATYTYSTYGTSPGFIKINGTVNGTYNGVTPNISVTYTVPARPWANPAATTGASVARVSDTQQTVTWTNNSTTSALYGNIKVYRKTDAGAFALITTLGVVTSHSDVTSVANHKYRYRPNVLGANGTEVTGPETGDIWTSPGAPTVCAAVKLGSGNIQITWTNNVNYSEYSTEVWESQNGGAYALLTTVATGLATYTHIAPSTIVTHKYKVRSKTTSGTSLVSSYSNESALVVLLSTASAPTITSPSGVTLDATEAITFTWVHNPTDGTPQNKYQLQYSIDGGGFVTVGPTTTGVSSYVMPASTLTNAHTITWKVATAGENGTLSAYSSIGTFFTKNRPTSTISVPDLGTYSLSTLTATWTYFQAQSSAQASWHAYLYLKGALPDFSDATLLEEVAGAGTGTSTPFATALLNGVTYGVRVYVTSAAGQTSIASGTSLEEFTVTFLPPATATLAAVYDDTYGHMVITITGTGATLGVTEAISTVDLERQINGGDWVTWATGIVLSIGDLMATVTDPAPTVKGSNNYRAIVRSALPSSAYSAAVEVVTAEPHWGYLSAGNNFAEVVRMRARLDGTETVGREKSTYEFAGRDYPVELAGEALGEVYAVTAALYPPSQGGTSSEPEDVREMGKTASIVLWRDYTGRRLFASLSDVSIGYIAESRLFPVSFSVRRVDYDENVG